jgi:hypothetical protein
MTPDNTSTPTGPYITDMHEIKGVFQREFCNTTTDKPFVIVFDGGAAKANDGTFVIALAGSEVIACEGSHVVATPGSHVCACAGSYVFATENSHVIRCNKANVVGVEGSNVETTSIVRLPRRPASTGRRDDDVYDVEAENI